MILSLDAVLNFEKVFVYDKENETMNQKENTYLETLAVAKSLSMSVEVSAMS